MQFRRLIAAAALAAGVATSMTACGAVGDQVANSDTAQTAKQEAQNAAAAQLQSLVQSWGFDQVTVGIENEDETVKVAPKRPAPKKPSSSATPAKPAAKPKPTTSKVTFQVITVDATYPKAFKCGVNLEQRLDKYGVPSGLPYFDEVLVPGTDGVEVVGAARDNPSFAAISQYVFTTHPECVLPGVLTAPVMP